MYFCYTFETKSVQTYILDSGKLADMINASERVESLCGTLNAPIKGSKTLLEQALDQLGLEEQRDVCFSRRGGGSFLALLQDEKNARRLRDLWSTLVRREAPGLPFTHALTAAAELPAAMEHARIRARINRNRQYPELPLPGPLVARAPRTGRAAKRSEPVDGTPERQDPTLAAIHDFGKRTTDALAAKLKLDEVWRWPSYLEQPPEIHDNPPISLLRPGDDRYVAIIHADGNGVGSLIAKLDHAFTENPRLDRVEGFAAFSRLLEENTVAAARKAITRVLTPERQHGREVVPARFFTLAGDDTNLIVRADLAFKFTDEYLSAFEQESEERLKKFKKSFYLDSATLPEALTACAGVALVKANQPFRMAYGLAKGLCESAKRASKQSVEEGETIPSSFAFHRVTTALVERYDHILKQELSSHHGALTLGVYGVGNHLPGDASLPRFERLRNLAAVVESGDQGSRKGQVSRSALRRLLTLFHSPSDEAVIRYNRWRELMEKRKPEAWRAFDDALGHLLDERDGKLPLFGAPVAGAPVATPLSDALVLATIEGGKE